jgi:hypothetical protein
LCGARGAFPRKRGRNVAKGKKAKRSKLIRLGGRLYRVELVERATVKEAAGRKKKGRTGRRKR